MPPKRKAATNEDKSAKKSTSTQKRGIKADEEVAQAKDKSVNEVATNKKTTTYDQIDFSCIKKNALGNTFNLCISNWNVDGLRAWLKKDGLSFINYEKPDICCLQETKCSEAKLPDEIKNLEGYELYWHNSSKEGYAGVGLVSRIKPISVKYGIGDEEHDSEGRCICAEYEKFFVISVYVPNAGRNLVTLPKRLEWNKLFKKFVKELDEQKPVIICGDMNVAHSEIDLTNPKTNVKNAGFTKEEREGMTDFLSDGYVDTFRKFYPDQTGAYTFWSYMKNARSRNIGWRLDYFITSDRIVDNICDSIIRNEIFGSDHCPITLFLNM